MTTPSDTQNSRSEASEPTNLGHQCSKKETEERQTDPIDSYIKGHKNGTEANLANRDTRSNF